MRGITKTCFSVWHDSIKSLSRRYIITNLELGLQEAGLLDSFLQKAQKAGMTLVDYLRLVSTAALPIKKRSVTEEDGEEIDPAVNAVWERMLSDPTFFAEVSAEAYAQGIDFCNFDRLED